MDNKFTNKYLDLFDDDTQIKKPATICNLNSIKEINKKYEIMLQNYGMENPENIKQYCSESIKKFREYFGLKQATFARIIGLSRNVLYNCETGKSILTYQNLLVGNERFNKYIDDKNLTIMKNCFAAVMSGAFSVDQLYLMESTQTKPKKYKPITTSATDITSLKSFYRQKSVMKLYDQLSPTDQAKIMDRMEHIISTYNDEDAIPTKRIAVLGQTACGNPIEAISIADEFIETNELKANFALRAVGDSMSPLINDGDIILIKQTEELEINDIGIFQINESGFSDDEEVTCKMLKSVKDGVITLVPLNAAHDPIVVDTKKQHVKVIGKYLCKA